jgi:hypothetical protein
MIVRITKQGGIGNHYGGIARTPERPMIGPIAPLEQSQKGHRIQQENPIAP